MATLRVYSRRGCHLCENLIEELMPLLDGRVEFEVCDIDTRSDWREQYDTRVPVVEYDGELVCQYHLDRDAIARVLGAQVS